MLLLDMSFSVLSVRIYILRESIVVLVARFGDVHPVKLRGANLIGYSLHKVGLQPPMNNQILALLLEITRAHHTAKLLFALTMQVV